jgi:phospholipase/carboxylesterase
MPGVDFIHHWEDGPEDSPVVLLLHGTGGDESDLLPLGRAIFPGARLLSPRGKILEQGMPRFFRRLSLGVFDEEDLKLRTHELADFLIDAGSRYGFRPEQVTAFGYSNGANIAAALLLLRPEALANAILLRATVPLRPQALPDLTGKSILLSEAHVDSYVTRDHAIELETTFRRAGAEVEALWIAPTHALDAAEFPIIQQWAKKKLRHLNYDAR